MFEFVIGSLIQHRKNTCKINDRRLGVKTGAKRKFPTGNPSPAPTHPHRTHDTTDQWRDRRWWLGRFLKKCLTVYSNASNVHSLHLERMKRFVNKSWGHGKLKADESMLSSRNASNYNGFVEMKRDQVWRIGSVLVHVSQLSSSRVRWTWRLGSVLVHVSQLTCFRMRLIWRIGSFLVHVS